MAERLSDTSIRRKCLIYARVSSTKQTRDGSGLSSQEHTCREFAGRKGYEVVEVFTDIISGRHADRPGMNMLLRRLKREKTDFVVVVDDISRFARDVSAHATLRDQIIACGAKIESPHQKFGEDAGGRFVETVMAAIAEHERLRNAEQSHRRSIACLESGKWIFRAPVGYRYDKAPDGGKCLVPDEPIAGIITEALNGFANGRFQSQGEVKRFLESKTEFPKTANETYVHWDKVKRILTDPIYSGYVEFRKWGITRRRGIHEPLISFTVFQINQGRIREQALGPARKDINRDFPLRGYLVCGECEHPLSSCWSKGRRKKYPYYLCQYRGCCMKGKSIPREKIHALFDDYMKDITPTVSTMKVARRLFREAWAERHRAVSRDVRRLKGRVQQLDRDIENLLTRLVQTENLRTVSAYERRIAQLEDEKTLVEEEISNIGTPTRGFDEMFEHAMRFLSSPYVAWKNGSFEVKRTVLKLVFEGPLIVSRNHVVRTGKTTYPINILKDLDKPRSEMVPPHGLEPRTY
jgi:site-specific DNA recombinase